MILWIIFSESGPAGPGPAKALIVSSCQFLFVYVFNQDLVLLQYYLAAAIAWVSSAMAVMRSEAEGLPPVRLLRLLMAFCREA